MKTIAVCFAASAALGVGALSGAVPEPSGVTMTQSDTSRRVTIAYTLVNAPAVVTFDIQTNTSEGVWVSIGARNIQNYEGDVAKLIETDGEKKITWRPDLSWPDHQIAEGGARAVVTAWAPDNTPDYMVVDLKATTSPRVKYYVAEDALPGGLLANLDYRLSKIVMRKVMAKGVAWTMGNTPKGEVDMNEIWEKAVEVTLTNNYYLGVFELTQAQYAYIMGGARKWYFATEGAMRPADTLSYGLVRDNNDSAYYYPADPYTDSVIGKLRALTGIDFDLPSEGQWEFACRAGTPTGYWNDGTPQAIANNADAGLPGRYLSNQADTSTPATGSACGPESGTAVVGSYAPNAWGFYDMHGNVSEWCLDWFQDGRAVMAGQINADGTKCWTYVSQSDWTKKETTGSRRVLRGGQWNDKAQDCRSSSVRNQESKWNERGCRLAAQAGLK